jgi:hypothetical protein
MGDALGARPERAREEGELGVSSSEETRREPVVALVFLPVREWQP